MEGQSPSSQSADCETPFLTKAQEGEQNTPVECFLRWEPSPGVPNGRESLCLVREKEVKR